MDMPKSFFFYDLETSGLNARDDRIMQFAGQRTDLDLKPLGDPVNLLVKLPDDTLPSPGAIMVTKITPQMTLQDGLSEAEFCQYLEDEIFIPGTCAVGYNSVRFDDEFMRHLFWRNFRDPYEWQWKDGRSRWDLLDVVRLTRALRPDGINWPTTKKEIEKDGQRVEVEIASNRLELLSEANNLKHEHAHDALSDVEALIQVTALIKEKQQKLYDYLLKMRDKKEVMKLVNLETPRPFVYATGRYSGEFNKTSVAFPLAPSRNGNVLVYDLRKNPSELDLEKTYPTVKELCYNKCPAVAPLGVLEKDDGWNRIGLDKETVEKNLKALLENPTFAETMRAKNEERPEFPPAPDPESALYDGFLDDQDRQKCSLVKNATKNQLADLHPEFTDPRLEPLLLHYKAKNFPDTLSEQEQQTWEEYRRSRLTRQFESFKKQMEYWQTQADADQFVLEELTLWYQSLEATDY